MMRAVLFTGFFEIWSQTLSPRLAKCLVCLEDKLDPVGSKDAGNEDAS